MQRWRAALVAGLLAAALPGGLQAVTPGLAYALIGSPLVVAQGEVTDFTFTATNLDLQQPFGCVEVLFPDEFWISSLGSPVPSNGEEWSASRSGQWVLVYALDGGGSLEPGQSVTFTVTAMATTAGEYIFDTHVHVSQNCDGTNLYGTPLTVTVLQGATPVPTPVPTATPRPTPRPTPVATTTPTPTATSSSTPSSTPTRDESATPRPSAAPASLPGGTGSGGQAVRVAPLGGAGEEDLPDDLGIGVDVLGLLNSPFEWLVPGALVGGPGLLVILFVGLQAVGALAWIPAVRRMGDDDRRRGRRRPVSRGA